ncbi:MAG: hypothetical protein ACFHVJ_13865 [Aestuariibacter sp.]
MHFRQLIIIFFIGAITACGGGGNNNSTGSLPLPPESSPATDYKQAELDFIQGELKARHPNLFFKRSETEFDNDVETLRQSANTLSDIEFRLESTKLVATIGDQHTYMIMHEPSLLTFPVEVWWVGERAIVTKATDDYQHLLGQELLSIDGIATIDMQDTAMQYLAYENPHWKDALSPRFLKYAELLAHEGSIASAESAAFTFVDGNGNQSQELISSLYQPEWTSIESTRSTEPVYAQQTDNYWATMTDDVLFIQYNSCFDISGYPLTAFVNDLAELIGSHQPQKVAVDLRFNHGGRINHFLPVIDYLADTEFNQEDRLFVITGRHTFSSGVGTTYSFLDSTNATFIGMPTGGKPNSYSHVIGYSLSGSLNSLYMATNYLAVSPVDVETFTPDALTPFTQEDFLNGSDPALRYVINGITN